MHPIKYMTHTQLVYLKSPFLSSRSRFKNRKIKVKRIVPSIGSDFDRKNEKITAKTRNLRKKILKLLAAR